MAVKIDETIRTSGVITNSKGGFVRLAKPIGESDTFKSMSLSKFADNDLVELIFRVSNSSTPPSRQLVRATKLELSDRFWVAVTGVANLTVDNIPAAASWLLTQLGYEENALEPMIVSLNASVGTDMQINLREGMTYDEAWDLRDLLANASASSMTFEVIKHTQSDMPSTVSNHANHAVDAIEWVGSYWVAPALRPLFQVSYETIKQDRFINMMLKGESGYGKTSLFKAIGDWLDIPVHYVNCAQMQDTEQWFGYQEARGGETIFIPTDFSKAVMSGHCLIILDEFNRVEPWMHNTLLPLLDHRRETEIHGVQITAAPGIIFAATINDGARYAGTNTVDVAMMNRFPVHAEVEAPPAHVEVEIIMRAAPTLTRSEVSKIASAMADLRRGQGEYGLSVDISTRSALAVADLMTLGLSSRVAAQLVIINGATPDDRKGLVDTINMKLGTL